MPNNWVEELEQELKGVFAKDKVPQRQPTNENLNNRRIYMETNKVMNNSNPLLLFGVVLILAVGIFVAWKIKTDRTVVAQNNWQQGWQQQQTQQPWATPGPQPVNPNNWQNPSVTTQPLEAKVEQLKRQYETIDAAAQKIWERTKWNSDRITLLATVNNHNLVVMQQNLPKTELIFLNSDWTINRMPNRIQLDANDQEFLRRFVRTATTTTN